MLQWVFSWIFNKNLWILYLLTTFAARYAKINETYKAHEEAFQTLGRLSTALYNRIFKTAFPPGRPFCFQHAGGKDQGLYC
jgi:hypothetical protein